MYFFPFSHNSSHNAVRTPSSFFSSKMAASPSISMYRLPTYYEAHAVPLPNCMYSLPSYFQTNSKMEVSRLGSIICATKRIYSHACIFEKPRKAGLLSRELYTLQDVQPQESSSSVQSLESRQENILCELNELKAAVEEMANRLGVSLPRQKVKVRQKLIIYELLSLLISMIS